MTPSSPDELPSGYTVTSSRFHIRWPQLPDGLNRATGGYWLQSVQQKSGGMWRLCLYGKGGRLISMLPVSEESVEYLERGETEALIRSWLNLSIMGAEAGTLER